MDSLYFLAELLNHFTKDLNDPIEYDVNDSIELLYEKDYLKP